MAENKTVVLEFIDAINNADIAAIEQLMADDHVFIDSAGYTYQGKDLMKKSWINYFEIFPDYRIETVDFTQNKSVVGVFGYASGTYKGKRNNKNSNYYRIDAAWKVIVKKGQIARWQIYCESKKPEEIVARNA